MLSLRSLDIYYKVRIVSGTISEMVKTVSNVSMHMMLRTANTQSISGETLETIWMSQQWDVTLNGLMNVSIMV